MRVLRISISVMRMFLFSIAMFILYLLLIYLVIAIIIIVYSTHLDYLLESYRRYIGALVAFIYINSILYQQLLVLVYNLLLYYFSIRWLTSIRILLVNNT